MKFNEYEYVRPNMEEFKLVVDKGIESFNNAMTADEQIKVIKDINKVKDTVMSAIELVYIRNSVDTLDEYYDKEMEFADEAMPEIEGVSTKFFKALLKTKFRDELVKEFGELIFIKAENQVKTFDEVVLDDLKEENKLSTEYRKLLASAKIPFDNKELNLSELTPYRESKDRDVRKEANKAYFGFMSTNLDKLDGIYDKLVKLRVTIAKKLGFESFVELGYARMERLDYDKKMVANFRNQVKEFIVPICTELRERQTKRLNIGPLKYYDLNYRFNSGNPVPKGDPEWIVKQAEDMYKELSSETHEFFTFMQERELLDLVAKKGKAPGGYCTYIPDYRAPFIFSNFNGTLGDVTVLTHEVGHAFQVYNSRDLKLPDYLWPTSESAEIHSMGMEFLTWSWMDKFFLEDADKFRYVHLEEGLQFIPYGVSVDEFQHYIYENPNATPEERRAMWREIENKYTPGIDYDNVDYLETGGFWQRQAHIYEMPFYYIDYTLAQICAFQYLVKSLDNKEKAWDSYLNLCKAGGSKSFLGLLDLADLKSPFVDGTVEEIVTVIKEWLDNVDDSKF